MKHFPISFLLAISLAGCGSDESGPLVSVKNHPFFHFDNGETIGEATEAWAACDESKWRTKPAEDNGTYVSFNCKVHSFEYFNRVQELTHRKPLPHLNVKSNETMIVFKVDDAGAVSRYGAFLKTTWADGAVLDKRHDINKVLEDIQVNRVKLNPDLLTDIAADFIEPVMVEAKSMALIPG